MKLLKEAAYPRNQYTDRLEDICKEYGYEVRALNHKYLDSDKLYPYIQIHPSNFNAPKGSVDWFLPRIYFDDPYGSGEGEFTVGTTSYGSLKLSEMTSFMIAMNKAYDLVRILSKFDFSKLPVVEKGA